YLLAFHDSASLPAGQIGVTQGYALANVDTVNIDVKGLGGHGAYPQNTKDPIVLASRIVVALQTLVSRENDPLQPAVVTVGSFHAGTKSNIFWVGGVPKAKWDAAEAKGELAKLPSLHSPLWAPDADAVISTATEAMTVAALDILKKG